MKATTMKRGLVVLCVSIIFSVNLFAQVEKPVFYTNNGTTVITSGNLDTLLKTQDLKIKFSLPDSVTKFDYIQIWLNNKNNVDPPLYYLFNVPLDQARLRQMIREHQVLEFWIFNPNVKSSPTTPSGIGDFSHKDMGTTLGPKNLLKGLFKRYKEVDVVIVVKGYTLMGYDAYNNAIYRDEIITESEHLIIK